jgi:hypothetical protein
LEAYSVDDLGFLSVVGSVAWMVVGWAEMTVDEKVVSMVGYLEKMKVATKVV